MLLINTLNRFIRLFGAEIVRFPKVDLKRRMIMLNYHDINLILDVGANKGEYTMDLINLGYRGVIESFEPIDEAYKHLEKVSKKNKLWNSSKIALGNFDGETEINVAGNINSSSLLDMLPNHILSEPKSKYTRKEKITVNKLDTIFPSIYNNGDNAYLKIDVQGYEMEVLKGAENSLNFIKGIQIEMSIELLYEGSILYNELIQFLETKGYELFSIENGFSDPVTGKLLQFDGIFFKK